MFLRRNFLLWLICFIIIAMPIVAWADDFDDAYIDSYEYYENIMKFEQDKPYDYKLWERNGRFEQKVFEVGFRLLNENKLKNRISFMVLSKKNFINAFAFWPSSNVIVFKQLFPYFDNDDELAALLAHEIGHIQQYDSPKTFCIKLIDIFNFTSKHYEHDADLRGVDLMVNAGYNPVAMVSFLNKLTREDHWLVSGLDYVFWFQSHPNGSKRLRKVYNHILANYPKYLVEGYDNPYYANFLLNAEKDTNIKKIKNKHGL